jgi:NADH:ubiquinone oxidoreductase subunit H
MSPLDLAIGIASGLGVLLVLFVGTFFFLFLERFIHARLQHRDGPGRHGNMDPFQVWKDFLKTRVKKEGGFPSPTLRFWLAMFAWQILPAIFLLILLGGLLPPVMDSTELPALLLLPLLAVSLEAAFLHGTSDLRERIEWRKRMVLRVMGASLLALAFLTAALQVGLPSLSAISLAQNQFPYHSILSSPGLFLSGLAALGSIFLFANENPIQNEAELSISRSRHYLVFFVRRMWVFCLLSFWVLVFMGGVSSLPAKALFPFKLAAALFFFTLLQGSFPRMRTADAGELASRWLLRLCLAGLVVEAVWVGVRS